MNKVDARPKRILFGATATKVAGVLLIFELLAFVSVAYYLMIPVARRSADDLAALMIVSAHTWITLEPEARTIFESNLERHTGVRIEQPIKPLPQSTIVFPYIVLLKNSLTARAQNTVTTSSSMIDDELWYWLDTTIYGKKIRFGVTDLRLGISPPIALALIVLFVIMTSLLSTLFFVRRVTQPLSKLAQATLQLEKGNLPSKLPENGITELATLAQSFNRMANEVSSLLTNRTTLLTGIAHDLRTPLARMRLSLELLSRNKDPKSQVNEIELDIDDMTNLINESLAFAAGIAGTEIEKIDICDTIRNLIHSCFYHDNTITLKETQHLIVNINVLAIRRIILNLLNNALRYGNNQPIIVTCVRDNNLINIQILDHGIGIPEDEIDHVFEPFYRIDESRSLDLGGNGLGLSIVKQLADANNWNISLSPTPGGGLTASLTIPINN